MKIQAYTDSRKHTTIVQGLSLHPNQEFVTCSQSFLEHELIISK
jgi:hypothetical protein